MNLYVMLSNNSLNDVDYLGLISKSKEDRISIFNKHQKENRFYLYKGNERTASFLSADTKASVFAGFYDDYRYNRMKKTANRIEKNLKDSKGRKCYEIDIYRDAINADAIYELPWYSYDKAILLTHSYYVSGGKSFLTTGEYYQDKRRVEILISNLKNVEVFGCHLSGKSGVDLSDHQVMDMVDLRFRKFKAKKCCNKPMRIQVVSASLNKYTFTEKN